MPDLNSSPSPEWSGLEAALSSLTPTPPTIDRDQLMYEAGRAARPQQLGLQALALVACAAIALGIGRWTAPTTFVIYAEQIKAVDPYTAENAIASLTDPASYYQLRRQLADGDLATIASPAAPRNVTEPSDRNALLRELLN